MHDSQTLFAAVQERTSLPADSIHALFEAQAKRTPHATAVEYGDTRLTYRDLNERAERFASIAAAQGVGRETIVGIGLERSLALPIAMFGVLKAGGVCMPLDPEYPRERLAYMMEDAGAEVLVAEPEFEKHYSRPNTRVISPSRDLSAGAVAKGDKRPSRTQPGDAAYIV